MPRKNGASKRSRKSSRASAGGAKQQHVSWTGRVARRIKTSIKKLVG